jgi:hypothetical protein
MRNIMAAIALVLATGASAQTPPDNSNPPGAQPREAGAGAFEAAEMRHPPGPPPAFGGPGGPGRFGWRHPMPPPPPPSKAAHFRLRNGQTAIEVKCADAIGRAAQPQHKKPGASKCTGLIVSEGAWSCPAPRGSGREELLDLVDEFAQVERF